MKTAQEVMTLMRLMEGDHLLKMDASRGIFSQGEQDEPQAPLGKRREQRFLSAPGLVEGFLCDLASPLMLSRNIVPGRQVA
jgi:hypothetical protein